MQTSRKLKRVISHVSHPTFGRNSFLPNKEEFRRRVQHRRRCLIMYEVRSETQGGRDVPDREKVHRGGKDSKKGTKRQGSR